MTCSVCSCHVNCYGFTGSTTISRYLGCLAQAMPPSARSFFRSRRGCASCTTLLRPRDLLALSAPHDEHLAGDVNRSKEMNAYAATEHVLAWAAAPHATTAPQGTEAPNIYKWAWLSLELGTQILSRFVNLYRSTDLPSCRTTPYLPPAGTQIRG